MAKTRGESRATRLRKMEEQYLLRGYTDVEMAERLEVKRQTVHEDRLHLMAEHGPDVFEELERGRYKIRRDRYLSHVRLSLFNSLPLYLFARKSARQLGVAQPHVIDALEKLAGCLRKPMLDRLVLSADALLKQPDAERQTRVFEAVATAWAEQRLLDIDYVALGRTREIRHTLSPYVVEPSVWSDAVYVIGWSEPDKRVMPFKLDRIAHATVRGEAFEIPEHFNELELLRHAWGIWTEEGQPKLVVLRFSGADAIQRVRESRWHPLEESESLPDGRWEWRAPVAQWREMLPWIRGWGADVEVVGPDDLRAEILRGVRLLSASYQLTPLVPQDERLNRVLRCWGKTTADPARFHPALYHMLDVGHVAQILLGEVASPRWLNVLRRVLGWPDDVIRRWVPFLIGLHDIGKISVSFARQNMAQFERMRQEGFDFGKWMPSLDAPHSLIGQVVASQVMAALGHDLPDLVRSLAEEMIGGHHGEFASPQAIKQFRQILRDGYEPSEWVDLRVLAAKKLAAALLGENPPAVQVPVHRSGAVAALTGFAILCDWLGSDGQHFVPQPSADFESYIADSQRRAEVSVRSAGLIQAVFSETPAKLRALFPNLNPPRPLQEAIDAIPDQYVAQPCLAIIEAPTGEGKTEAAMALAHRIAQSQGTDELYCALPTMATSNQMFRRMQVYLRDHLRLGAHVSLVHGQAFLVEDDLRIEPMDNGDGKTQHEAIDWFSAKKRALLAPFGVGTIDQAELATLNVRHNMLRMIGLAGKVVILDEVHAYDTYMSTIIERLVSWLSAFGTSVILLSATLPLRQRRALAKAYGATAPDSLPESYPSLIVINRDQPVHVQSPVAWQPDRQIEVSAIYLKQQDKEATALAQAQWLLAKVDQEGCACWICNTVAGAQALFHALQQLTQGSDFSLMLLHARFPLDQRQDIEKRLAATYGHDGNRPRRGIVVGTQVLEQSLDLDFDVMVSDLAPVDLLLQRAGRLHRHRRLRPQSHGQPRLWIHTPLHADATAPLDTDARIYDEYLLRQTWTSLSLPRAVFLPRDYRPLVEAVYGGNPTPGDAHYVAWQKLSATRSKHEQEARLRLLPEADAEDSFTSSVTSLAFDEDENSAAWRIAQTRLGDESIAVIPMEITSDTHAEVTLADGERLMVRLDAVADRALALKLLRRNIPVSNHVAVAGIRLAAQSRSLKLFSQTPLLKNYYPLLLKDGRVELTAANRIARTHLDQTLGLIINTEGVSHD